MLSAVPEYVPDPDRMDTGSVSAEEEEAEAQCGALACLLFLLPDTWEAGPGGGARRDLVLRANTHELAFHRRLCCHLLTGDGQALAELIRTTLRLPVKVSSARFSQLSAWALQPTVGFEQAPLWAGLLRDKVVSGEVLECMWRLCRDSRAFVACVQANRLRWWASARDCLPRALLIEEKNGGKAEGGVRGRVGGVLQALALVCCTCYQQRGLLLPEGTARASVQSARGETWTCYYILFRCCLQRCMHPSLPLPYSRTLLQHLPLCRVLGALVTKNAPLHELHGPLLSLALLLVPETLCGPPCPFSCSTLAPPAPLPPPWAHSLPSAVDSGAGLRSQLRQVKIPSRPLSPPPTTACVRTQRLINASVCAALSGASGVSGRRADSHAGPHDRVCGAVAPPTARGRYLPDLSIHPCIICDTCITWSSL
jgi:hypothetical protein